VLARVAVGTAVASRPPRRSRRAAFPHRAPVSGRTRSAFGVLGTHAAPIRGLAASVTGLIRRCVRDLPRSSPSPRPAAVPPPSPPPMLLGFVRGFTGTMQPSDFSPACMLIVRLCLHKSIRCADRMRVRSPRFRRKDVSTCMGSSTARGPSSPSHFGGRVLPSLQLHEIGASEFDPFRGSIPSLWHPL
jgi:hypothetical protein